MPKNITIQGKDPFDEIAREKAIGKINSLTTEELKKLAQMCTPKGRKMLVSKWNFIKTFI